MDEKTVPTPEECAIQAVKYLERADERYRTRDADRLRAQRYLNGVIPDDSGIFYYQRQAQVWAILSTRPDSLAMAEMIVDHAETPHPLEDDDRP